MQKDYILDIVCEHQFVTHILYVSDGEEFGLLSFEILVVGLYQFHVSLNVACRHKHVPVEPDGYVAADYSDIEGEF